jgi:hypothetical protein
MLGQFLKMLERERAALERDKDALHREKAAALERERAAFERERERAAREDRERAAREERERAAREERERKETIWGALDHNPRPYSKIDLLRSLLRFLTQVLASWRLISVCCISLTFEDISPKFGYDVHM